MNDLEVAALAAQAVPEWVTSTAMEDATSSEETTSSEARLSLYLLQVFREHAGVCRLTACLLQGGKKMQWIH